VNGEVCKEKGKKLWKERKKDLTPPALLEMDGYGVSRWTMKSRKLEAGTNAYVTGTDRQTSSME
jgi:hypothetical protein